MVNSGPSEGDTIVVIGFSYARGGTEVGLFDIDRAGKLAHRATYHLRSNDYYSSRNYASRLVGSKLTPALGQQFIVDNRSGGSGSIGTGIAAKAVPDKGEGGGHHERHGEGRAVMG